MTTPEVLEELEWIHWMTFGHKLGVVGANPIQYQTLVERLPLPDPMGQLPRLLRTSRKKTEALTPQQARVLVWLAREKCPDFAHVFFPVVVTAEDLLVYASVYLATYKHLSRMAKEYVAQWIELGLTTADAIEHRRYHRRHRCSLADLIRLTHPTFGGKSIPQIDWILGKPVEKSKVLALAEAEELGRSETPWHRKMEILVNGLTKWPSRFVESVVKDSDIVMFDAASPYLSLDTALKALPRRWHVEGLLERIKTLQPTPSQLLHYGGKIPMNSETTPVRRKLWRLIEEAQTRITRPHGTTVVLIDRAGSCPRRFFYDALAAASFGPSKLYLVDDVFYELDPRPRNLLSSVASLSPRGGFLPHKVLQSLLHGRDPVDHIILFTKSYPFTLPEAGPLLADFLKHFRTRVNPEATFTTVLPSALPRVPGKPSHLDRIVFGIENFYQALPWLRPLARLEELTWSR